jgi:hypothetical protein
VPGRTIFRESAIEAYRRGTEKDIVPRLISRPIVFTAWLLVAALIAAAVGAWWVRVPSYTAASGAILGGGRSVQAAGGGAAAVLFVPPDRRSRVKVGDPVHVQLGAPGTYASGVIAKVEPRLLGPETAGRRYGLRGSSDVIAEPSVAVVVRLRKALPRRAYAGAHVTAKIEAGSQRLLELLLD